MTFAKLSLQAWKQFEKLALDFHPRLTILTGANVLAKHLGWDIEELATPAKDEKSGRIQFFSRFFKSYDPILDSLIGEITYSNQQSGKAVTNRTYQEPSNLRIFVVDKISTKFLNEP